MTFSAFKDWVMLGLLTAGVVIFWDLNKGVGQLNITMAVITEKVISHDKNFERHDERLHRLEQKR